MRLWLLDYPTVTPAVSLGVRLAASTTRL